MLEIINILIAKYSNGGGRGSRERNNRMVDIM